MDEGEIFGRGIAFPPRIGPDGRLAWSSGPQNIREAIQIILLTELQERLMLPGFGGGLQSFLFQPNIVSVHRQIQERVTRALARWEPRIALRSVTVEADLDDAYTAVVTINYQLVATQAEDRISLRVRLAT
jgi:uncharacterized protein